jgi:hypothetical protein
MACAANHNAGGHKDCEPSYPGGMEYFFACPYCSERISMVLDTSVAQTYIEDCEVCCRPIEVRYTVEDDEVSDFEATAV